MNRLNFTADGAIFNDALIPDSYSNEWRRVAELVSQPIDIVVTNELPLSGWVEEITLGGLLKLTPEQADVFLTNSNFKNHIYSWRILATLSRMTGRKLAQGCLPSTLKPNSIALIVYIPNNCPGTLGFTLAYAMGGK